MKLSNQIIASITGTILLLLIIGFTSQYFNSRIINQVIDEKEEAVTKIRLFGEMETYLYQSLVNIQYYLDEPYRVTLVSELTDSTIRINNLKNNVRKPLRHFESSFQQLEEILATENYSEFSLQGKQQVSSNALTTLEDRVDYFRSLIEQLFTYSDDNFENGREFFTTTLKPFFRNSILPLLGQSKNQIRTNLDRQVVVLNDKLEGYSRMILFATLLAFLIALILAYVLYYSTAKRIKLMAEAARDIGHGNLDKRIEVKTDDEIGQLGLSFNKMAENLNKITFSKEFVDNIIESIGDGLIVTDEQTNIKKINTATVALLSYETQELMGSPISKILKKKDHKILLSIKKNIELDRYETQFIKKSGEDIPVSISKAIIHNNDGTIQGMVCVFSDISERKRSEKKMLNSLKEKEILLAEIHHRVKNNLAVISGLLQMQLWETENPVAQQVLEESQLRVKSIALVHEKLYQSEELSSIGFDKYIDELLSEIHKTYQHTNTEVEFDTEVAPVIFNINQAIPCSLLINELVINNYKHAFTGRSKGKILIQLSEDDKNVTLTVKDNGVGFKKGFKFESGKSMGMTIINTLVRQLKGHIKIYNDEGAVFEITFRIEKV